MAKEKDGFIWMATVKDLKTAKQTVKMFEDNKIKAFYIKKTIGYLIYTKH